MTDTQIQSALNAISSLQLSVADLSSRVGSLSSQVHAQGGTVTPQGQAITTNTSETSARASADDALATRAGAFSCNLDSCRPIPEDAAASATSFLTTRVTSAEESTLAVDPGQAVEPLRLGKVTFYCESARVIRDAQAVLQAAGAGQLEMVKRANEPGEPFVLIDGQVFINEAEIKSTTFEIKVVRGVDGQYHAAGFGVGVEQATGGTTKAPIDADHILSELTKLIGESELSADLGKWVAEIERTGSKQGAENRTLHDRLAALEANQDDQEGRQATANSNLQQRITELSVELKSLASK